jgi:hypothetical protein
VGWLLSYCLIDSRTNRCCGDGLTQLLAIVQRGRGAKRWIARAEDFVFADSTFEPMGDGRYLLVTRFEDRVETHPVHFEPLGGQRYRITPNTPADE